MSYWYMVAGNPFHSPQPRTDLGPEIPAPGSDPVEAPAASELEPEKKSEKSEKKETKKK